MRHRDTLLVTAAALVWTAAVHAQDDRAFVGDRILGVTPWRHVGPANFGGRIVDIEVDPQNRFAWYAVTSTGGIWKTTNNGTTFAPLFTDESAFSIGDLAIAPSDPNVLYVGTGEANNQRSSYWGDGVHKSTDGGATWQHVGLDGTDHIGRIVVHPTDPNVVYVAALGALYSANDERGLYRSTDGGATWKCVKHLDADVGFVDVAIDPKEPKNLLAASYDRRRRAWDFRDEGPGSKVWRSTDGGDTWTEARGIPGDDIGRIGVAIHPVETNVAYAIVENNNPAPARREASGTGRPGGGRPRAAEPEVERELPAYVDPELHPFGLGEEHEAPGAAARPIGGELYKSEDGGKSWKKVSERAVGGAPHYYYGQIRLDPKDPNGIYLLGVNVWTSRDGGASWSQDFGRGLHVDHHALWIDPQDPRRALLGNDGGIAQTWDGGETWIYHDDLPIGQFYAIGVDLREPYNVYGGTQDNGSWGIPSRSVTNDALTHTDAFKINGGDGFYVEIDPSDPDVVYSESQFGGVSRLDLASGRSRSIRPRAERGQPALRFNWMSPILISPHDPATIYFGSQYLHRSEDRGDSWESISGDLTTNDADKLRGDVPHCTITTIAESPLRRGRLWVGTDDGNVWTSPDGGRTWVDLRGRFDGVPAGLWVSRVSCSPHDADRAYVAFTGYREDDRKPYLFMTTDGGATFRSIVNDLPPGGSVNVVREHPRNESCVLAGTEFGVFASIDGGGTWHRLGSGLPTQPVHDLLVHPRDEDVVIGTHGRGIWILDGTVIAEFDGASVARGSHVFRPRDGRLTRRTFPTIRYPAARGWSADATESRPVFRYLLPQDAESSVTLRVLDVAGQVVFERRGDTDPGVHEVVWQPGRGGARRGGPQAPRGGATGPGDYLLEVEIGGQTTRHPFRVHPAPGTGDGATGDEVEEADGGVDEDELERGSRGRRDI